MDTGVTIYKPKSAVSLRREMAKDPEIMNALEPVERSVFLASTVKTFAEYTGNDLVAELAPALKFIAKDVGYRATDEQERQYLLVRVAEILKRYYGKLTMRDFRLAFEMSIAGELDDYLPKGRDGQADRGHYQQFNAEYICKILNAYRTRRAGILKRAYDIMPQASENIVDPAEVAEFARRTKEECIKAYEYFKENGHLPDFSPIGEMLCYTTLSNAGLAPEIIVTLDEQKAILQRTITRLASKGMIGDMQRFKDAGPGAPELQPGAYKMARRKALKNAFAQMASDGINITDYIKLD